jgi:hypothetical protein
MNELIEKSNRLRLEAEEFYIESNLKTFLPKFGEVSFRGSYDLNLMTKRDLDIYIINPSINHKEVLDAFNRIAKDEFFYGYYFFDRKKFPKEGMPLGYYIGLKGYRKERIWKVDLWFLTEEDAPSSVLMKFIKDNLTEKSQIKILELKKYRDENNLDISGKDIYEAVLKSNIQTEDELRSYISKLKN